LVPRHAGEALRAGLKPAPPATGFLPLRPVTL